MQAWQIQSFLEIWVRELHRGKVVSSTWLKHEEGPRFLFFKCCSRGEVLIIAPPDEGAARRGAAQLLLVVIAAQVRNEPKRHKQSYMVAELGL